MTQNNDVVDPKYKTIIDNMSYMSLLARWRRGGTGDMMFQGATGRYYAEVMDKRKAELSDEEQVAASKSVGLEGE